jgi:excisionase family DNA binding protein
MAPITLPHSSLLVFTVTEVSNLLQISRPKVYMLIQEGIVDGVKIGADWRVLRTSLERIGAFEAEAR